MRDGAQLRASPSAAPIGGVIKLEHWPSDDPVVVALHPDVEHDGMPDLRIQLHDVVAAGARDIVVDASCLDELPSPVIGALLTAHRACRGRGGRVAIRFPSRRALDQLQRTGLWRVFDIDSKPTSDLRAASARPGPRDTVEHRGTMMRQPTSVPELATFLSETFTAIPEQRVLEVVFRLSRNGAVSLPVLAEMARRELAAIAAAAP